ncbi:MAG: universal stress protein [Bacteroidota bacterium]|nr:universal stress protein [Bacteroidota bacterium]
MTDKFEQKNNLILVAYDFTNEAKCALKHANNLAKTTKSSIELIHIITKDTKNVPSIISNLNEVAETNQKESGISTKALAEEGDIFTSIGKIAEDKKAWYLVFGTHGVKGMQHILGAFALKVVSSSPCPVIIVQNKTIAENGYKNILIPIDKSKYTKQKVYQAISLAKQYNSNIHLFNAHETDEQFLLNLRGNIGFIKNKLHENDLDFHFETNEDPKNKDGFGKQVIKYASSNNIDLIFIMAEDGGGLMGGIVGAEEIKIINNDAQIPVMCINPTNYEILGSSISFGGFS